MRPSRFNDFGSTINSERRQQIVDILIAKTDLESVLEAGCGRGMNLFALREASHKLVLQGFDLNPKAINDAKQTSLLKYSDSICFDVKDLHKLDSFKPNTYDYVLLDSVCMYIHPKVLPTILTNLLIISRRGLMIRDQHSRPPFYSGHYWLHDYLLLADSLDLARCCISRRVVPRNNEYSDWTRYGYIFDILKQSPHVLPVDPLCK